MRVPVVGCPGTECGYELLDNAETRRVESFKAEYGECDEFGKWLAGRLFLCDKHAAIVAADFGDSLDAIRAAIMEQYA